MSTLSNSNHATTYKIFDSVNIFFTNVYNLNKKLDMALNVLNGGIEGKILLPSSY